MAKGFNNLRREIGGHVFLFDSRFGAHGTGNFHQGKKDAQERADSIRRQGRLARITKERMDYGIWWVVWATRYQRKARR